MQAFLSKEYPLGYPKRNFHPKMHGCLMGSLHIHSDLPQEVRHGLFAHERTYDVWIRFSNAPPRIGSDTSRSGRGLAIKVLGVEGEIIEEDPLGIATQNFLLTTSPILSASSIRLYSKAMKAVLGGFAARAIFALNPLHWRSLFLTFKYSKKHSNLLSLDYFSGAPFRLGPSKFAKFVLTSNQSSMGYSLGRPQSPIFLKEQLIKDLSTDDYSFLLNVQLHEKATDQPLEDTSVVWKGALIPVATLKIPKQEFDFQERVAFGESLQFSPWMALVDHEPIGEINIARRIVYKQLAAQREIKPETPV